MVLSGKFKLIFLLFLVPIILGATSAYANPYIKGGASLSLLQNTDFKQPGLTKEADFDYGFGGMLGAGWTFSAVSLEVEMLTHSNALKSFASSVARSEAAGDFNFLGAFLNAKYNAGPFGYFSPFISSGIGICELKLSGVTDGDYDLGDASDTVIAYQVGLGVDAKLTPELYLEGGWRFLASDTADFKGTEVDYKTNLVWFALKYYFQPPL